jgi:hypothetical protein
MMTQITTGAPNRAVMALSGKMVSGPADREMISHNNNKDDPAIIAFGIKIL